MTWQNDDQLQEVSVNSKNKSLECMALKSGSGLFVWMLNNSKTDMNINTLQLNDAEGYYTAKWFNPWTGQYSEDIEVMINESVLSFNAVRIDAGKDMALWVSAKK